MNPLVSIIVPSFNRELLIAETLASIKAQTYLHWECIVVDDGSTDTSLDVIEDWVKRESRIRFLQRPLERRKGANACRNIGLENAKGDYLLFLDSDDLLAPDCIQGRVAFAKANPQLDLLIFQMEGFTQTPGDANYLVNKHPQEEGETYLSMFLAYNIPWQLTTNFIKRSSLEERFDEELDRFQDVDFSIRYLLNEKYNHQMMAVDRSDCYYRYNPNTHPDSATDDFVNKVVGSLSKLMYTLIPVLKEKISNGSIPEGFLKLPAKFYLEIFKFFILKRAKSLNGEHKELRKFLNDEGVISAKTARNHRIVEYLHSKRLVDIKGIGAYRLSKYLMKEDN